MYRFFSGVIGALAAVMILLNGALASRIGNAASNAVVHLTGLILIILTLLATRSKSPFQSAVPPALLSGGALGFLTVLCANAGFIRLGVSLTLALGLLGQAIAALAIDQYGWLGAPAVAFDWRKLGCLALVAAGIGVMAWL